MTGRQLASRCAHWLNRSLRLAVPFLAAWGLAVHLILLAFAVTSMAGMGTRAESMLIVASDGDAPVAKRLAMVLCRPGAAWTDGYDTAGGADPDGAHMRQCCGICALQGAGLPGAGPDYSRLPPDRRSADVRIDSESGRWFPSPGLLPPARGPPAVPSFG